MPITAVPTWPVMAISGMLSSLASAMAVTRFVAPGPLVAMHTPGLPVLRAIALGGERPPLFVPRQDRAQLVFESGSATGAAACWPRPDRRRSYRRRG